MGEEGIRTIFAVSLHQDKIDQAIEVLVDTTVQEKNVTFPTDTKLAIKTIKKTLQFADKQDIKLKQTFAKELKALKIKIGFSHHLKRSPQGT